MEVRKVGLVAELPPRARRIPHPDTTRSQVLGTTSACAENTSIIWRSPAAVWNYLRVRGEYICMKPAVILLMELPPRARRIPRGDAERGC